MMATGKEFEVTEVGVFTPKATPTNELTVGDVGFLTASIKMSVTRESVIQ